MNSEEQKDNELAKKISDLIQEYYDNGFYGVEISDSAESHERGEFIFNLYGMFSNDKLFSIKTE